MTSKRMTRAEMIQWLGDAIRTETEKPFDEIDYDFVNECGNLLDELMGKSVVLSENEIEERLVKLKADISASSASVKTKRRNLWKIVVAAAIVLCMSVTVFAVPTLREIVISVLQLDVGESVEIYGITYINGGVGKVYPDIDTLISEENLDLLSFEDPNGKLKITAVDHIKDTSTTIITFNDPSVYLEILHDVNHTTNSVFLNNTDSYTTTEGLTAYLFSKEYNNILTYNAYLSYKNDTYSIMCSSESTLISILNSLNTGE